MASELNLFRAKELEDYTSRPLVLWLRAISKLCS